MIGLVAKQSNKVYKFHFARYKMEKKRSFYLPFIALLTYTIGAFFLNSVSLGGVYLSPGGGSIFGSSAASVLTVGLLTIVVLTLFFSIRKKSREKN